MEFRHGDQSVKIFAMRAVKHLAWFGRPTSSINLVNSLFGADTKGMVKAQTALTQAKDSFTLFGKTCSLECCAGRNTSCHSCSAQVFVHAFLWAGL